MFSVKLLSAVEDIDTKEEAYARLSEGTPTRSERVREKALAAVDAMKSGDKRFCFLGDFDNGRPDGMSISFMSEEAATEFKNLF